MKRSVFLYICFLIGLKTSIALAVLPNTPLNQSPSNGESGILITPVLKASAFSDPDGHTHANSRWQICSNSSCSTIIRDTYPITPSTTFALPTTWALSNNTTYWWRVRYKDSNNEWSNWSTPTSFTTLASGTQVFNDVPQGAFAFNFINTLYSYGITSGCGGGNYCPDQYLTRGQMAVFVIKSLLGYGDFSYPTAPYFTDVPTTHWAFKFIQKMRQLGITGGCTPTAYCPDSQITRGQMAVFVITALFGGNTFDYPTTPYFTDVPSTHPFFKFIQKMKQLGITGGCTPTAYCPDNPVTRAEMAVFLKAAFLPPKNRKVFVTSVSGNGNLSTWTDAGGKIGLEAGDAICQARANTAGFIGIFRAWLSDDNDDAYCRVHNLTGKKSANCGQAELPAYAGPWIRTDGFPFGETIDQILSPNNKVYAPARFDEFGNAVPLDTTYFTNTHYDGTLFSYIPSPCSNWTSNGALQSALSGLSNRTADYWTWYSGLSCSLSRPLLCFQTGAGPVLPDFSSQGKKVFLTSVSGNGNLGGWADAGGNTGLQAGDAICRARAQAEGIENASNFIAWLSNSATDVKDRITSNGPWVRLDGAKVADNKADLIDGSLFTPINLTETGIYLGRYSA